MVTIRNIRNVCCSACDRFDIYSPPLGPWIIYINTSAEGSFGSGTRGEGVGGCKRKVLERNYEVLTVQQVWRAASKDPIKKQIWCQNRKACLVIAE